MKAHEIIEAVGATLTQRGQQNGYDQAEERSAAEVVRLFNQKTGRDLSEREARFIRTRGATYPNARRDLSEREAWEFLRCLKEVRLRRQLENGSDPTDTLVDLVGYTVLLSECLTGK